MAINQLFIVAAPRSGAGLFHKLALRGSKLESSRLSSSGLQEFFESELSAAGRPSHSISDLGLAAEVVRDRIIAEPDLGADGPSRVDYHPSLAMNVPLIAELFPQAKFVFVSREPAMAIASGVSAWQSQEHITEPKLAGWWGTKWSYPLISGWQELVGEPINEVVARQYQVLALSALAGLTDLEPDRYRVVSFEQLLEDPSKVVSSTLESLGMHWDPASAQEVAGAIRAGADRQALESKGILELARDGIRANSASFHELIERLKGFGVAYEFPKPVSEASSEAPRSVPEITTTKSEGTAFAADFAGVFPELLSKANASVVFSAYNSGFVGTVRANQGSIDTSYIKLPKPMGIAVSGGKLAIGTLDYIKGFNQHNQLAPALAVEPDFSPDTVLVPQNLVYTGNLAIHDMAYGTAPGFEGLWFVNTSFSCLSLMNPDFSFVPKWRPKWISSLALENRCHLNGLAMVDGAPRYVTSLSQADTPAGWRDHKGTSGVIVDITTNRIIADGLSMPHSPRWHKNKLYFCESGKGSLSVVDHRSGEITTIATLPGFTRGLSFIGNYALVGLSQVRETAFKDLPVTSKKDERNAGIWIVDIRNGQVVGTLKFDGVIQEIFEVAVLENSRWPIFIDRIPPTSTAFVLPKAALRDVRPSANPRN